MPTDCISYQKSGYFTKLIVDYLDKKTELKSLYNRFPTLENFKEQLDGSSVGKADLQQFVRAPFIKQ
jgi:hypothetical protein